MSRDDDEDDDDREGRRPRRRDDQGTERRENRRTTANNWPTTLAGICGAVGAGLAMLGALQKYNFAVTAEIQRAVGFVVGGLFFGAVIGYAIGTVTNKNNDDDPERRRPRRNRRDDYDR